MSASHDALTKPSILLVLICLAVVHRQRPAWLSINLDTAARDENVSPQRLSRLCSRALAPFQTALDILTRIGRPVRDKVEAPARLENALLSSLLGVATAILRHVSLSKPALRALVMGAYLRLSKDHRALTKDRFCQTFALSPRTFRYWMAHRDESAPVSPVALSPEKKPPKKRPPRRPRFGFDVTLPDTQVAADTTDIEAFGLPLKLVAAQDVGGRDQDLFDAIIVDNRESADHVVRAITEALDGKEGQQVISDQGTPYMAEVTKAAIEALGAEHAPQKEGDPIGKATIERAFGIVKQIAAPILDLTSKLAAKFPKLRDPHIAKAAATLLLTALLKAYNAGARAARRADDQRASVSRQDLEALAEKSRENARAENRSVRLLLTHIHRDYEIKRPLAVFIKQMRRFPLPVLKETEHAFGRQVHRDDIKDRASYFAAIARRCNETHFSKLEMERRKREEDRQRERHLQHLEATQTAWKDDPAAWLQDALNALATQWIPERNALLFGGAGIGRKSLNDAIDQLIHTQDPTTAKDTATGVFMKYKTDDPRNIGPLGLDALRALLETTLEKKTTTQTDCKLSFAPAILRNNGP